MINMKGIVNIDPQTDIDFEEYVQRKATKK